MTYKEIKLLPTEGYSHGLYRAITEARLEAEMLRMEFVTPEHVLLRLLHQRRFADAIMKCGVNVFGLINDLKEYLRNIDIIPKEEEYGLMPSSTLSDVLEMITNEHPDMEPYYLLVGDFISGVLEMEQSFGAYIINNSFDDVESFVQTVYDEYTDDKAQADSPVSELKEEMKFDIFDPKVKETYDIGGETDTDVTDVTDSAEMPFDDIPDDEPKNIEVQKGRGQMPQLPPDFHGISITFGLAGKMLEQLAGAGPHAIPQGAGPQKQGKKEKRREPWEEFVERIYETYVFRNKLIGREKELERTMQILLRKEKNNVLHVGEPGVGKTALIYGLAQKIAEGSVPEYLQGRRIYGLDMTAIVAGASYHGELENRIKAVMDGILRRGGGIVYIDEIHSIIGAGSSNGGPMDALSALKPYFEDGRIRFIGSTTYQDYNRYIAKSKSIVRRFEQVDIQEPSIEEAVKIVEGVAHNYEIHHRAKFEAGVVRYAVEKSAAHISDRFLPDKAIDIIDEAGAFRQMHPLLNKKGEQMSPGRQKIGKDLINDVLAKVCKINAKALTEDSNAALRDLKTNVCGEIYGQDEAVEQVVRAVKMSKAGLTLGDKPLASLLFVGPTGVGKTEVCKVLAQQLGIELVRFDMSEYTEKHTVAKLIGSPAGYVGYDDGGLLTDAIRKTPNCVLLLDEIEKAHSDIYNILLQVMDYARLTDNRGNKVDFRNVILVMTSNAGAQYAAQAAIGFGGGVAKGEAMLQTVKKTFKPEFLNRLSGTVVFNDMDQHMASLILDKKLRQLSDMLEKKGVTITLTAEARQFLMDKGYSRQYGAREMDRVIQQYLTPLLMDEILFGKLKNGGLAGITYSNDKLQMEA